MTVRPLDTQGAWLVSSPSPSLRASELSAPLLEGTHTHTHTLSRSAENQESTGAASEAEPYELGRRRALLPRVLCDFRCASFLWEQCDLLPHGLLPWALLQQLSTQHSAARLLPLWLRMTCSFFDSH